MLRKHSKYTTTEGLIKEIGIKNKDSKSKSWLMDEPTEVNFS